MKSYSANCSTALSTSRRVLLTVLTAVAFVVVLAFLFWAIDPCAQGPA